MNSSPGTLAETAAGPAGFLPALDEAGAGATRLADVEDAVLAALTDEELGVAVGTLAGVEARWASLRARLLAEADDRRVADETAATGTAAWLAHRTRQNHAAALATMGFALLLRRYPVTQAALREGRIGEEQARIVVRSTDRLPVGLTEAERTACETALVEKATRLSPSGLRKAARRMLEAVEQDRRVVDEREGDELDGEEQRAEAATWLALHDNGDGTYVGRFQVPALHGQMLAKLLECLTAPRRTAVTGEVDPTAPAYPGLSWSERLGRGFLELIEHLPGDGLPGGVAATVVVHLDEETLRTGVGAAALDTGGRISAAATRRLACGAGIVPMVLGGGSVPLDLGRQRRLFSPAQRLALSARYDQCAAEGCDRPFAWCELHHLTPWSQGGRTDLDQAVPLCGHHHRRAHDRRYRYRRRTDGSVVYEVVRPPRWSLAA